MAFQMPYSDVRGNAYAASYWYLSQINIVVPARSATLTYLGFKDQPSQASGLQAVGSHQYKIGRQAFAAFLSQFLASSGTPAIAALNAYAAATQDTPDPNNPGQLISFFAGATPVGEPTIG